MKQRAWISFIGLIAMTAGVCFELIVNQELTRDYQSTRQQLLSERHLARFLHGAFSDAGKLVMTDPDESSVYLMDDESEWLNSAQPQDILAKINEHEAKPVPAETIKRLFSKIADGYVDYRCEFDGPIPYAALKVVRHGETVVILLGTENQKKYMRVFVVDYRNVCVCDDRSWNRVDALFDEVLSTLAKTNQP